MRKEKALVSLSKSTQTLFFNPKMVNLLDIKDWRNAMVGYDRATNVIVMKEADAEEYGSVVLRKPGSPRHCRHKERADRCRMVFVGHIMRALNIYKTSYYRAERSGLIVFLKNAEENDDGTNKTN